MNGVINLTLKDAKTDSSCEVLEVKVNPEIERRLEALGITEGTKIKKLNSKRNGAVVIKVRGTRLALGSVIAFGIKVREV